MNQNTISVIVLTYNQKDTVARTLESILSQKTTDLLEIIVGDDCSTDGTADIIAEYADKYPNIVIPVLRKKNMGVVKNYYDILSRTTGKYIMGCAGDDYWLPGKIKLQIEFLENNPQYSFCYSDIRIVDQKSDCETGVLIGCSDNTLEKLLSNNHVPAVTIAYTSSFRDRYLKDIEPQNKQWPMEDYPMALYAAGHNTLGYCPGIVAVYNIIDGSISNSVDKVKRMRFENGTFKIRLHFLDYFHCNGKISSEVRMGAWISRHKLRKLMPDIPNVVSLRFKDYLSAPFKLSLKAIYLSLFSVK